MYVNNKRDMPFINPIKILKFFVDSVLFYLVYVGMLLDNDFIFAILIHLNNNNDNN